MRYEQSMDEWLEELPAEFAYSPIGMWEIVPAGRDGFGLEGPALVDFVRKAVRRLLEVGARPVKHRRDGPYYWAVQTQYGETIDDMVVAIADEQMRPEAEDTTRPGLWFAMPDMLTIPNLTVGEWIAELLSRLDKVPISLSEITLEARVHYEVKDPDLPDFTRNVMRRLLEHGAHPARISREGSPEWLPMPQFGEGVKNVLDAVMAEWTQKGLFSLEVAGLAFALPKHIRT